MDLAFHQMGAGVADRWRQRFQGRRDQLLVGEIGKGERIGAGDQEVEHAMLADVVAGALVIDAAAAERLRHEPGAGNLFAPERLVEQQRNAQIVRRPVEVSDVLDHRLAQLLAFPAHGREPGMRQAHQHEIELARLRALAVHHVEPIAAACALADPENAVIELDIGIHFRLQAIDELLVAVLDGIEADVAVDIHQVVLQRVQPVGVVAFGRDVGTRHHLEEAFGDGVGDFLVEHLLGRHVGPGVFVVVRADALVILGGRHQVGTAFAKCLDRRRGPGAVSAAHARHVVEQFAAELDLLRVHRNGLQAEMLDQLAQRIGAAHRVVIDLGNAGLVHRRRRIELARENLAAETVGRLEDRDAAQFAQLPLQVPSTHEAARAPADDCKIKHDDSVVSGGPVLRNYRSTKRSQEKHFSG